MKGYLFLLVTLLTSTVVSQVVNIPDPNFKSALIGLGVDTNGDNQIQTSEAAAFTDPLYVPVNNISDMTGIEAFVNITEIQCGTNQITQLDLSNNLLLEELKCGSNDITSLILGSNPNLRRIELFANPISDIDLGQLPNLEYFGAMVTGFTELDVSLNPMLEFLDLSNSPITAVDVSNNPQLKYLNCAATGITSIDVSNNPLLELLFVSLTNVSTLNVSGNTALKLIGVRGLGLNTLDLSNNTNLEYIDLRDNLFTEFDFSIFPNLVGLRVRNNLITQLDLSANNILCHFLADSHVLEYINVRNGSNPLFFASPGDCTVEFSVGTGIFSFNPAFSAAFSDNLEYICVDDVVYAQQNFTEVPPGVVFIENCELSVEDNLQAAIRLVPNPTRDRFTVSSVTSIRSLVIRNAIGQQMVSRFFDSSEVSMDISELSTGLYFVEVTTQTGAGVHRLLKE